MAAEQFLDDQRQRTAALERFLDENMHLDHSSGHHHHMGSNDGAD